MMYYTKRWILRFVYKLLRKSPTDMDMVDYWKHSSTAQAKVTRDKNGATVMHIEGEKEVFPGYPRGHSLFGSLSPLKHQIKNLIFNDSWAKLENNVADDVIISDIKRILRVGLAEFWEEVKYDAIPVESMVPPVREIWRAMTTLEQESNLVRPIKEMLCFILQEDDAYRFRAMDMFEYFNPNKWYNRLYRFLFRENYEDSIKRHLDFALSIIEHCEIIGDMKERQRLLKRILFLVLKDERILGLFGKFCQEVNFKKLYLTKADRYHFRGKYYKVDFRLFEY